MQCFDWTFNLICGKNMSLHFEYICTVPPVQAPAACQLLAIAKKKIKERLCAKVTADPVMCVVPLNGM